MWQRCTDPNIAGYERYGGAGIRVCERWSSFNNFFADMGLRPPGKTLDRRDGTKNYEPGNCRWATPKEQSRNIKSNKLVSFNGVTKPLVVWAEEQQIPAHALSTRLLRGWSVERALTQPAQKRRRR